MGSRDRFFGVEKIKGELLSYANLVHRMERSESCLLTRSIYTGWEKPAIVCGIVDAIGKDGLPVSEGVGNMPIIPKERGGVIEIVHVLAFHDGMDYILSRVHGDATEAEAKEALSAFAKRLQDDLKRLRKSRIELTFIPSTDAATAISFFGKNGEEIISVDRLDHYSAVSATDAPNLFDTRLIARGGTKGMTPVVQILDGETGESLLTSSFQTLPGTWIDRIESITFAKNGADAVYMAAVDHSENRSLIEFDLATASFRTIPRMDGVVMIETLPIREAGNNHLLVTRKDGTLVLFHTMSGVMTTLPSMKIRNGGRVRKLYRGVKKETNTACFSRLVLYPHEGWEIESVIFPADLLAIGQTV